MSSPNDPPTPDGPRGDARLLAVLGGALALLTAWSVFRPYDLATWFLEAGPLLAAVVVLALTRRRFPLTPLAYVCVALHGAVLLVGAHYTYAEVPLGRWAQDAFGFERNHYDRLGHVAQGFFPAVIVREVLLRRTTLRTGGWLFFLTTSVCLAVSAAYELLEWFVAVAGPDAQGVAFLGTQGDPWDTQWDMFLCLCGALASQALLSRLHDRQLRAVC